jgi:two-component system, OmpR family, sensor histidine kinase KdpD
VTALGGSFRELPGDEVADTLLAFARAENATQMVLGASRRSRFQALIAGKNTPARLAGRAGHIDVHLVDRANSGYGARPPAWPLSALRRRRALAAEASAEAAALTRLAAVVLRGRSDPPALLEEIREMFGLSAVRLLERRPDGANRWFVAASAGERAPEGPGADVHIAVTEAFMLAGRGRTLGGQDDRVLFSCATQVVAGIIQRRERIVSARHALDRVARLVTDVGDLSRLHASALETYLRPVDLDEVIAAGLEDLGPGGHHITLDTPEDLPDVIADAALLARILTSMMADALQRSPADAPPTLTAAITGSQVDIRVTDRGCGRDQGNGDDSSSLALRLARDVAEATGDTLRCDQSPEGGRCVSLALPAAQQRAASSAACPGPVASRSLAH